MTSIDLLQKQIENEISKLTFSCPPESLYKPIEYILSLGGKRIRPLFMLMACNLYKEDLKEALRPAIGLEVFHNFTLLHDDLMDKADKRRGKATVHKLWNDNAAVLSGDAMQIVAYQLIGESPSELLKESLDLFTITALEICGGQQYDMEFENRMDVTEKDYIEMIRLKTAVLIACALKMGAIFGHASEADKEHLYQCGINIGLAFQLQDDLLDVYGNSSVFGKNIGGDILCNKKTFLLINALKLASDREKEELKRWVKCENFDPQEKITKVTAIYDNLHLKKLSESKILQYYNAGMKELDAISVESSKLDILKGFCQQLLNRQC